MRKKHPNPNIREEGDKAARRLDQFERMRKPPESNTDESGDERPSTPDEEDDEQCGVDRKRKST